MELNIYLHGHGNVKLTEPHFVIPRHCTVNFYCYCNTLFPRTTVNDILLRPSLHEPVETISQYKLCPSTYLYPVDDLSEILIRKSLLGNKPNSMLLSVNDYGLNQGVHLLEILKSTSQSYTKHGYTHFNYHWLSCRTESSLNTTRGPEIGLNSGFHLNNPDPNWHGTFHIAPASANSFLLEK